ncbi:MAG: hypothetical protein MRJ68_05000 [Nitrospira sp.]|nr:hypothetical protein [Nitrospira sp.]
MRIFLFMLSIVSLLLAARQFSISEPTGQFKGALFLLLIGIQLLVAAGLISEHREERTKKSSASEEKGERMGVNPTDVNVSR